MKSETIAGLRLFYDPQEQEAARLIGAACERSVQLLGALWGLHPRRDCRVYVMTSWQRFLFQAAPGPWKAYLALTFPLVAWRAASIWPSAGGWALQFGGRQVVGVKPPRLLRSANRSPGEQFFIQDRDVDEKVQTVTCHELVHAFTFHLRLPNWLHEGLATRAMEHYLGRGVVQPGTLEKYAGHLQIVSQVTHPGKAAALKVSKPQALLSLYACGYWLTRYIEASRPVLLKALLTRRRGSRELEETMAAAYGKSREKFWQEIDGEVRAWFDRP